MAATQRVRILLNHIATIEDVFNLQTPSSRYAENNYPRSEVGLRQQIADALHLAAQHRQLIEVINEREAEITRLARQLDEMTTERDYWREVNADKKFEERLKALERRCP